MRPIETLSILDLWLDVCASDADWTRALTWTQNAAGARAVALVSRQASGAAQVIGASMGAPADFLNLCREIGGGPCASGLQERFVAGTGRLAWAQIAPAMSAVLFALYEDVADLDLLAKIADVSGKCFTARSEREARKTLVSLQKVALAQLTIGVAVLDRHGVCLDANAAAEAVFARADGLYLRSGKIGCRNPRDRKGLETALIGAPSDPVDLFVTITRDAGARPYVIRILRQMPSAAASIVMIIDPDAPPAAAPEVWRAMFSLTECELLVAETLVSGGNVTELAKRRGVTVNTVRQQKKSMLTRLEVSSQAAATAVLSRMAPFAPA